MILNSYRVLYSSFLILSVKIPKGLDKRVLLELVLGERKPDVWVIIKGAPMGLAVYGKRFWEVKGDENGERACAMEELFAIKSYKPILCMVNSGAFAARYPWAWAAFEIDSYVAIRGADTETHIGPWPMGAIGNKTCANTVFCAHFKGPQCVYRLGKMLGTNIIRGEWQPALPTPASMYWSKLRKDGVIPKEGKVKDFIESSDYSSKDKQDYVNTVEEERRGRCEKCNKARADGHTTY